MGLSVASQNILSAYNSYKANSTVKSTPTKTPTLSNIVIKMQQALSEKFGIPTFDLQGKVSTLPTTRPLNTDINVNTGSTGLTVSAFNDLLKKFTPATALVPTKEIVTSDGFIYTSPKDSPLVQGEIPLENKDIPTSISNTLQQYSPYIILGGLALASIMLLKR